MLQPGTILDNKYQIETVIGSGGFGFVYRALEQLTGEPVAIKELVSRHVHDRQMVQRFIQEARLTLRLSHPHIVRTYGIFQDHGTYYLAMEYLSGGSLACRLERGPLPVEESVRIAIELCEALEEAHREDIVHCDIKPANVLFDDNGRAHLADFGIAHVSAERMTRQFLTTSGTAMGTVQYMAPEQLEGVRDDPRSDIYALGAVLYHMLAGQPYLNFDTESTPAAQMRNIHRIQTEQPKPLDYITRRASSNLARVVEQMLSKSAHRRFATAGSLKQALQNCTTTSPRADTEPLGVTTGTSSRPSTPDWLAPTRLLLGAVGSLLVVLVVVVALLSGRDQSSARPTAAPVAIADITASAGGLAPEATSTLGLEPAASVALPEAETTQSPMENAVSTPLASPKPTSNPTSTTAPTRELVRRYQTIPLDSIANASTSFESPPTGQVIFGAVPFEVSERVFKTQASPQPDSTYPTDGLLSIELPRAHRVHLLLTAGNGFRVFEGEVIGRVLAACSGSSIPVVDLRLGRDVREWHTATNVVSKASRAQQVWSGRIAGFSNEQGHIDMLSLDLPAACQDGTIDALRIMDHSSQTVQSLDPALNLTGLTIEYYE